MNTLVILFCLLGATDNETRTISGKAKSATGQPLYELIQGETWSKGEWTLRTVHGRLENGRQIFKQVIKPGEHPAVPNISMTYLNSPKGFSVQWKAGQVVMSFTDAAGKSTTNTIDQPPPNLVGPGGILAAIRNDWRALRDGQTLQWKMIVPPKADAYSVRLVPKGIEKIDGEQALRVTLEADNWLIRLIAPSTDFWIDLKYRSTLQYRGMGATDGPDGAPNEAIINFKSPMLPVVAPN